MPLNRLVAAVAVLLVTACTHHARQPAAAASKRFVIVHGAWGGGWDWRGIDSILTGMGHSVDRVTLTGLGDRVHLASGEIGMETHIMDVVNTLEFEKLEDVVLIGHSYGGMVISGVAHRVPERFRHLVYVDAFVPEHGESVERMSDSNFAVMRRNAVKDGMVAPTWVAPNSRGPRDVPHPLKTLTDTLVLNNPAARALPATYILTIDRGRTTDAFDRFAQRAASRGWRIVRMENTDHVPERSAPDALVAILRAIP